jgi:hypothetical protein
MYDVTPERVKEKNSSGKTEGGVERSETAGEKRPHAKHRISHNQKGVLPATYFQ